MAIKKVGKAKIFHRKDSDIAVCVEGDTPPHLADILNLPLTEGADFASASLAQLFKKIFFVREHNGIDAAKSLELSTNIPVQLHTFEYTSGFMMWNESGYCLLNGHIYKSDRRGYSEEELSLQIQECEDKERRNFERLKNKFSLVKDEILNIREGIPENVRVAVWRRDNGMCARCKSRAKLEYDHIIPVSKGGSNTARNIELLCEACNRSKHDHIQ